MAHTPLSDDVIQSALAGLPGWAHLDASLKKDFRFGSFREAISFIVRVSFEAEQLDHHPEIDNVYNRVTLTLRTHDAAGYFDLTPTDRGEHARRDVVAALEKMGFEVEGYLRMNHFNHVLNEYCDEYKMGLLLED